MLSKKLMINYVYKFVGYINSCLIKSREGKKYGDIRIPLSSLRLKFDELEDAEFEQTYNYLKLHFKSVTKKIDEVR
jgi:hypothetical protein